METGGTVVLRTMPTSQNRDMGHPVLWQLNSEDFG
jgi:hypothetical protein